jgi:hypothetical protein
MLSALAGEARSKPTTATPVNVANLWMSIAFLHLAAHDVPDKDISRNERLRQMPRITTPFPESPDGAPQDAVKSRRIAEPEGN